MSDAFRGFCLFAASSTRICIFGSIGYCVVNRNHHAPSCLPPLARGPERWSATDCTGIPSVVVSRAELAQAKASKACRSRKSCCTWKGITEYWPLLDNTRVTPHKPSRTSRILLLLFRFCTPHHTHTRRRTRTTSAFRIPLCECNKWALVCFDFL